jgi:hypothetical protein
MGRVTEKVEAEQITATRSDERQRRKERVKWVFEGREIIQTNRDREDRDAERKNILQISGVEPNLIKISSGQEIGS